MRRLSLALCALVFFAAPAEVQAGSVTAGVASATFDLPARVPLAGYSRRKGRASLGVHDAVGVRALVIQQDETAAALVSCDLLIVDEQLFDAVQHRLRAAGLSDHLVLLLAGTHTHSGPGAYGKRFFEKISMGHFDPRVFDALADAIAGTVVRAHGQLSPVRVAYAASPTEGMVVNRMQAGGYAETTVAVCSFFREAETQPFAVMVNFSAHPTALGAWNRYLSADYPGVVMRDVQRRVPSATCLFFAGSVGDQAPVKAGIGFERAEWIGQTLAQQVTALVAGSHPEAPTTLTARQERLRLPPARVRLGFRLTLPRWLGRRLVDDDATLSLITIGDTVVAGVPCDLSAELGRRIQDAAKARGRHPIVVGFASDYIGYGISSSVYHTEQYETLMAFNGPVAGDMIVDRLTQMIDDVSARGP